MHRARCSYLHTRNPPVIHRDMKSPNLLVDSSWRVKVSTAPGQAVRMTPCPLLSQLSSDCAAASCPAPRPMSAPPPSLPPQKVSDFNLSKFADASTRSSSLAAMNPRQASQPGVWVSMRLVAPRCRSALLTAALLFLPQMAGPRNHGGGRHSCGWPNSWACWRWVCNSHHDASSNCPRGRSFQPRTASSPFPCPQGQHASLASDVFGYACVLWELLT